MKIGYKATYNFICQNHKFEIGQIYELPNKPRICEYGFHYCLKPVDVLNYYNINHEFRLLEIEDLSEDTITEGNKSVTNRIRIVREIPKEEYYELMGFVGNELTRKFSDGYWEKHQFDERNNLICFENSYGLMGNYQYDNRNNQICYEGSNGYWNKCQYDERNNCIYKKDNFGFWEKRQYDERNNCIYFENNNGHWRKRQYDKNNNEIYYEDSNGSLKKCQYDEQNNLIYYINNHVYLEQSFMTKIIIKIKKILTQIKKFLFRNRKQV